MNGTDQNLLSRIKVAAFDLDGTIMFGGHEPTERVRLALRRLSEHGVVVCAATGRDIAQISDSLRACFDYIVSANGAIVHKVTEEGLETLNIHTLNRREVPRILRLIERKGGGAAVFCFGHQIFSKRSWACLAYCFSEDKRKRLKPDEYSNEYLHVRFWNSVNWKEHPAGKLQALFPNPAHFDECVAKLRRSGKYEVLRMADNYLELTPAGITKSHGLNELCTRLCCTPDELIAFGDSVNDLDMLSHAGVSVAMGNAEETVKKVATLTIPPVGEDGVAVFIENLLEEKQ